MVGDVKVSQLGLPTIRQNAYYADKYTPDWNLLLGRRTGGCSSWVGSTRLGHWAAKPPATRAGTDTMSVRKLIYRKVRYIMIISHSSGREAELEWYILAEPCRTEYHLAFLPTDVGKQYTGQVQLLMVGEKMMLAIQGGAGKNTLSEGLHCGCLSFPKRYQLPPFCCP